MRVGRTVDAGERAELGRHLASRWPTARSTGLSLLVRSMIAAGADRVELLLESIRELSGCSDRPHHAIAELRLGRALLERDDRKAARAHLHAARTLAEQYGLTMVGERARSYLSAAGGRSPAADQVAPDALTDAERPVARLAARGASNREIADALFITVRTVEYHLTNVYRKLAVPGRGELAERLGGPALVKGDG
jgi:DNA-binding CsgD family transcriptional regulator